MRKKITVLDTVTYQGDGTVVPADSRFSYAVNSDEAPLVRQVHVTEEWVRLDFFWIKTPSMLLIENEEGRFLQKIPTAAEIRDIETRKVLIGFGSSLDHVTIRPGRSIRVEPCTTVFARCCAGVAKLTVSVFP